MFDSKVGEDGTIFVSGRLDASQVDKADEALANITGPTVLDLSGLEYISSAGISVILKLYKRLSDSGDTLTLTNLSSRVQTVFKYAGLDQVFHIT
ncbi:MAG: STAS domain-containing protein [Candidatus Eisenbacteria bacterium]|uniref:Anti-sigma factor antagonist n=1 Tax=Eiseniibacteriota bacterium TaxID=2212470 RepID=A0A7Y2H345_UNCEI|nr:STAS domain-containing protein [Candidatus Eisenbacteria bacterium]